MTLLLLVVIVAQIVSQAVMMRQLADARAEIDEVRRKYGYIRVENDQQVFVARIVENENNVDAYRIHIPSGHHYLLHLTDAVFPTEGYLVDPQPTTTLSMNSWKEGADVVLSYAIYQENGTRRVRVWTETEELFDYRLENWVETAGPTEGSHLQTHPQEAFSPDETIRFMWCRNPETQRGVMLWMEPVAAWQARRSSK
jgi:hypothetical protein